MAITLYRIQTDAHRETILDGIGAKLRGGRWNAKGRPLVYTATTPELCFLEYMVHLEGTPLSELPPLVLCEITVPTGSIVFLESDQLPLDWDSPYATPAGLSAFAEQQFAQYQALCLGLPSSVVSVSPSRNVLIDPLHPQRRACQVLSIHPYPIDPRLPKALGVVR